MKVLLINNIHYVRGGSERVYFETANLLSQKGFEVVFFSTLNPKNIKTSFKEYFVDIPDYSNMSGFSLFKKIKMFLNSIYSFKSRKALEEVLKQEKPDIVHIHNIYYWISPSILSLFKKYNVKVVQTLHDYFLLSPTFKLYCNNKVCEKCEKGHFMHAISQKAIKDSYLFSAASVLQLYFIRFFRFYEKYVDLFIAPSEFLRTKYIDLRNIDKNKIVTLPNFVDIDTVSNEEIVESNDKYVLFFGRLAEGKGVDVLIKNMQKVVPGITLKIVGDGNYLERLKKLSNELSLDERIEFTGYKSGKELEDYVSKAMTVIVPSIWYENCPMVILESFAKKKFVIATNIGAIPEFVKNDVTGALFDLDNEFDLADKINNYYHNPEKIPVITASALEYVSLNHSKVKYFDKLIDIYKSI